MKTLSQSSAETQLMRTRGNAGRPEQAPPKIPTQTCRSNLQQEEASPGLGITGASPPMLAASGALLPIRRLNGSPCEGRRKAGTI